jgi:hypothetical protein
MIYGSVRCSVLTEHRTSEILDRMDLTALAVDAFAQLGIDARPSDDAPDRGADLVLDPHGVESRVQVKYRALVTDDMAERLLSERMPRDTALLVIADRVTDAARKVLVSRRAGYLDLRGRLALRTDRLVIDAEVEPIKVRAGRTGALSGSAGLEVATALLMRPERAVAVRQLARELGRSPSTISDVLTALRRDNLIDSGNVVTDSRLFWQVADRWPASRTNLAQRPMPGETSLIAPLRLGLDDVEHTVGWALTDSAAAVAYGAPLAFRSDQVLDFYVPDLSVVRRATTLLGVAGGSSQARTTVRVAPVPAVVQRRISLEANALEWPLAHPLFVALDLAQDVGRGREILAAWTPEGRWTRVW